MSGETKGRQTDREGSCCERKKTDRTEEKCTYSFTCEDLVKVLFVFYSLQSLKQRVPILISTQQEGSVQVRRVPDASAAGAL